MAQNEEAKAHIRIVAICGSLRPGSYTRMALQVALRGARETGAEAKLIDLRDYQLIFCDGKENESAYPKDVFRLRDEVKSGHGLILGTPEYPVGAQHVGDSPQEGCSGGLCRLSETSPNEGMRLSSALTNEYCNRPNRYSDRTSV